MVNVGTVVDHTFMETHALRKTRSANPAETKPFSSCLQNNSPESAKHVIFEDTAENDEYVYTIGGDKQPNCKVKKTDGNDGQLRRIGRSHGQTHPQGVIQTEGSTSHQAQNFLLRIIHTSTYSGNYWGRNIR